MFIKTFPQQLFYLLEISMTCKSMFWGKLWLGNKLVHGDAHQKSNKGTDEQRLPINKQSCHSADQIPAAACLVCHHLSTSNKHAKQNMLPHITLLQQCPCRPRNLKNVCDVIYIFSSWEFFSEKCIAWVQHNRCPQSEAIRFALKVVLKSGFVI